MAKNKCYFVGQLLPKVPKEPKKEDKTQELSNYSDAEASLINKSQAIKPEDQKTKKISDSSHFC